MASKISAKDMTTWIQLDNDFYRHRKTLRLKRKIGNDAYWVPARIWSHCTEKCTDDLTPFSDEDLAALIEYGGNPSELRRALIEAGFLSQDGNTVLGWDERYREKMEFYRNRAKKAADARWAKKPQPSGTTLSEEREDEIRGEEIRKHDQASLKDATSMLQASDPSPCSCPWGPEWKDVPKDPRLRLESKYDAEWLGQFYRTWHGRKLEFKAADKHLPAEWPNILIAAVHRAPDAKRRPMEKPAEPPEPDGWQGVMADTSYGPGAALYEPVWEKLPPLAKHYAIDELKKRQTA